MFLVEPALVLFKAHFNAPGKSVPDSTGSALLSAELHSASINKFCKRLLKALVCAARRDGLGTVPPILCEEIVPADLVDISH